MMDSNFYMNTDGLNQKHAYYFQVQFQLMCVDLQDAYCDFVVWTLQDLKVQRIVKNLAFIDDIEKELNKKYIKYIFPEILTRRHEPRCSDDDGRVWCTCRRPRFGKMVTCSYPSCPVGEFHLQCVHLQRMPKRVWFCGVCRALNKV